MNRNCLWYFDKFSSASAMLFADDIIGLSDAVHRDASTFNSCATALVNLIYENRIGFRFCF